MGVTSSCVIVLYIRVTSGCVEALQSVVVMVMKSNRFNRGLHKPKCFQQLQDIEFESECNTLFILGWQLRLFC